MRIDSRTKEGEASLNLKSLMRSNGKSYSVRPNRDRFFYPAEWRNFFDNLTSNQKITFDILISTGSRINEARNIKKGDIDFINRRIILRVTKVKARKGEKNPRPRTIPISTQFVRRLKFYCKSMKNEDMLNVLSTPAANIAMKKTLKTIGITDWYMFSVHNVRKTLETWLIALDIGDVKISRHMGHDISTMIQHYVSPDIFSFKEKGEMREIIGDLYV